jgi:hypothetical protein
MRNAKLYVTTMLAACALDACAHGDPTGDPTGDDAGTDEPKRHPRDAAVVDGAAPPDAPITTGAAIVSCYTEGLPSATCAAPQHCCFNNYSSEHDGACTTATCTYGTILCDGPEDCTSGQRCCAHAIVDPDDGVTGYLLACQSTACGAAPANQELCHTSDTCSNGGSCVSTYGYDYDLPRTLSICR